MDTILSICIPTYNRAEYLKECLLSVLCSIEGCEDRVEILISDNASTDNTKEVVSVFQKKYLFIRYYRNNENRGDENFYIAPNFAKGKYIWNFADDDKLSREAISTVLKQVRNNYDLCICNYSVWNKDFSKVIRTNDLLITHNCVIEDKGVLLRRFGPKLNFLSCVIIKKQIFMNVSFEDFRRFAEYGVGQLYAIYAGIPDKCKIFCFADSLLYQRGCNAIFEIERWYQVFAKGSAVVFNALIGKGYSRRAIYAAKNIVLKDYIMHDISFRRRSGEKMKGIFRMMFPYYKQYVFFWMICVPGIFMPKMLAYAINKAICWLRKYYK